MPRAGFLLCLASAVAFGAMAIFGKLAYDDGATVGTLLSVRFLLAAALFWALVACTGAARRLRGLSRRDVCTALALGGIGYSAQAGAYFAALDRLDASLLSLLLYTFPAMVTVAAIALGRERASLRASAALALSSAGLVLVLAGAASGSLDPVGTLLGLSAAVIYTGYILTAAGIAGRVDPLVLSALVCTGAATTLTLGSAVRGDLQPEALSPAGFGWLAGIAVVSTVIAVTLFFAGLRRVGPTTASILSTAEPVTTVGLAYLAFGESLGPAQLAGGALVLAAVPVLATARRRPRVSELVSKVAGRSEVSNRLRPGCRASWLVLVEWGRPTTRPAATLGPLKEPSEPRGFAGPDPGSRKGSNRIFEPGSTPARFETPDHERDF